MERVFEVDFAGSNPLEVSALFLSLVARPGATEVAEQQNLYGSIYAWMLRERCIREPQWAAQPQHLVPLYACRSEGVILRDLKTLDRRLRDRLTAGHMAMAFLMKAETGATPKLPGNAKRLSINEISTTVLGDLKMADGVNVLSRVWKPSLPVIHLCAAWAQRLQSAGPQTSGQPHLSGAITAPLFLRSVLELAEGFVPLLEKIHLNIDPKTLIRIRTKAG